MSPGSESRVARPLRGALYRILEALARVCLRHGIPHDELAEMAKRAFVAVAHREWRIEGRKQTASRIAVLTGLHRKDVSRVLSAGTSEDRAAAQRVAYTARVIGGWLRDRAFTDRRGRPRSLPFEDGAPTFVDLVKRHGGRDVPGRAVLDELIRVGAVERARDGRLRLVARAYLPVVASPESAEILGAEVSDLIRTIDHNLVVEPARGLFQRRVAYDNLPGEAIGDIHRRTRTEGQQLLESIDRAMARRDRDANPRSAGEGRHRATVGVYFFTEPVPPEGDDET